MTCFEETQQDGFAILLANRTHSLSLVSRIRKLIAAAWKRQTRNFGLVVIIFTRQARCRTPPPGNYRTVR
jgi:hypothetical protein